VAGQLQLDFVRNYPKERKKTLWKKGRQSEEIKGKLFNLGGEKSGRGVEKKKGGQEGEASTMVDRGMEKS